MARTMYHTHATKEWLKREIRREGPDVVLKEKGLTLDQAMKFVDDIPTTYVPLTECGSRDDHGVCQGHEMPDVTASFLGHGEKDDDDAVRLHIVDDDGYSIEVRRDRWPAERDAFRVPVMDARVALLVEALYRVGRDDIDGARAAGLAFLKELNNGT